ncbi:MAG: PA-phosphatase, partial [Actinomycetota bacterium]|nr:PA-phosphatase [Actinomycetota bacterium]
LHVLANPGSGSPVGFDHSGPVAIGLPAARLYESDENEGLTEALERVAGGATVLAASGGDGTIGAAAEVAAAKDLPLLVLPGGTLNHLARDLRVDSVADAIDAYKAGEVIEIDVGTIDGLNFINTATLGAYPRMIELRENLQGRIGRWPAHVISVLWTVSRAETMDLKINGETRSIWMVFVGNCAHEPAGFAPGWRPRLDDGKLDLRVLHGETPLARLRLIVSILAGRLTSSAAYERRLVDSIKVESGQETIPITRDGDHLEVSGSFTIGKNASCLTVFAPHD